MGYLADYPSNKCRFTVCLKIRQAGTLTDALTKKQTEKKHTDSQPDTNTDRRAHTDIEKIMSVIF
jgi:hypothetical protein